MFDISTVIIEPYLLGGLSFGEEQHVSFYTLCIEDASRQAKNGVKIKLRE